MFVFISLNADIPLRSRALVVGIICAKIFLETHHLVVHSLLTTSHIIKTSRKV
jgi:hypothetical protein